MAQYSIDGSLDPAFGIAGISTTPITQSDLYAPPVCADFAFLPNGKIFYEGNQDPDLFLVRFNSDGTLDSDFGVDGMAKHDLGQGNWSAGMTLQPDGKFIIVGAEETGDSINHYRRFLVMRFLPDGSPDPNFGAGGKVVTNFPYLLAWAGSAYTLPDNRILVVGDTYNSTNYSQVALARYFGDSKVYLPLITKP